MMSSARRSVQRNAAKGSLVPAHDVLFGASLGQWNGADAADAAGRVRLGVQADRDGLDLFTVADHPYFGDKLDAYALTGFLLGQTERITGMVTVTNLPSRPAPVLARTLTSLSALSGGRVILGIGAGAIWDMITKLGIPRLDGGAAVRAMAEAITLVRALSGGGDPVTFDGEFYHVDGLDPAAAPAPRSSPARSARSPWPSPASWPTAGSRREVRTG
jgi:alkanesulfonate monooxygenase SsuD/methylene tetrahydromethanopterin reductase-like flavin-dependent oxidoreductase (luciferase family)